MEMPEALPHRYPFQLLDRVVAREPGRWAVAVKCVGYGQEPLDESGALPPALLLECLAQAAGLAAADAGEQAAVLAAVDRFRVREARGGDRLLAVARVVRRFGATARVRACLRKEQRWIAAADLVVRLG